MASMFFSRNRYAMPSHRHRIAAPSIAYAIARTNSPFGLTAAPQARVLSGCAQFVFLVMCIPIPNQF
jgi:hypothetical protein